MKMNKIMVLGILVSCSFGGSASANLAGSVTNVMTMSVYGVYTTADPLCLTGWVATSALTATPTAVNFAATPTATHTTPKIAHFVR